VYSPNTGTGDGDFRVVSTAAGTSYVLNSFGYTITTNGVVFAGYDLSGSTIAPGGVTSIVLQVFEANGQAIQQVYNGFCTSICTQVVSPTFQAGDAVLFRLTINTSAGPAGAGNTILVDNFSNGGAAAALPVDLKSFNAKRNNNSVVLNWETVSESNVKGFEIQRKASTGSFEKIGFVPSKALNGNSNATLRYTFNDLNNSSAASQYRIVSVDLDGKTKISIIRSVDGLQGLAKIMIYPNPSNGPVNVVFPNTDTRNIQLTDLVGRIHASWKSYNSQDLVLNKLLPGSYMLHVTNVVTNKKDILRISITK
jgi:hypothetical protein